MIISPSTILFAVFHCTKQERLRLTICTKKKKSKKEKKNENYTLTSAKCQKSHQIRVQLQA